MTKKIVSSCRIIGDHKVDLNLSSKLHYLDQVLFPNGLVKDLRCT